MVHWPEVAMLGRYLSLADQWLELFMVGTPKGPRGDSCEFSKTILSSRAGSGIVHREADRGRPRLTSGLSPSAAARRTHPLPPKGLNAVRCREWWKCGWCKREKEWRSMRAGRYLSSKGGARAQPVSAGQRRSEWRRSTKRGKRKGGIAEKVPKTFEGRAVGRVADVDLVLPFPKVAAPTYAWDIRRPRLRHSHIQPRRVRNKRGRRHGARL
ncbi:hypothetical protein DFH08DRAFT_942852 [Mycena albidolilacea]|uniref:Uncharacterized protein n=1 Tax=Mycena albidolilacea TaxID=1033008 RepID=A0AAD6ZCP4_9AGAR|nr:hypothetical protein DFH08DRAFT_942852 [Mycena albidolilacea]